MSRWNFFTRYVYNILHVVGKGDRKSEAMCGLFLKSSSAGCFREWVMNRSVIQLLPVSLRPSYHEELAAGKVLSRGIPPCSVIV